MKKKVLINSEISFGNPYFSNTDEYQPLEEEEFEIIKDGIKTIITCKFNKGYMVTFSSVSEPISKSDKKKQIKSKERFVKTRG